VDNWIKILLFVIYSVVICVGQMFGMHSVNPLDTSMDTDMKETVYINYEVCFSLV